MGRVIRLDEESTEVKNDLAALKKQSQTAEQAIEQTQRMIAELYEEMCPMNSTVHGTRTFDATPELDQLNNSLEEFSDKNLPGIVRITSVDVVVSVVAGIIASVIDIVFVGTPEVVKIYKKGERFDRSILTAILRKLGSGNDLLSSFLTWLSEKCKVPYDISAVKDTVTPDNHRLRSFSHDPLLGLLFAVVDIIMETTTLIDDNGVIQVIKSTRNYPIQEKYLAVLYYLGHLLSDVCTARGIPIPGFFLTQFFTGDENSIARKAEQMYKDGYDLRHLGSMSTPLIASNLILKGYIYLAEEDNKSPIAPLAQKEIDEQRNRAYKTRLQLISHAVSCGGNVIKFFIPLTSGNLTALNLPEWFSLLTDIIATIKYEKRDKTVEQIIANRTVIESNWTKLALPNLN